MIRSELLAPVAICAALAGTPAFATGGVYCDGVTFRDQPGAAERNDDVGIYLTVGRSAGFPVVNAKIHANGQSWHYKDAIPGEEVTLVQAAMVGGVIAADFADTGVEEVIISLRVIATDTADDFAAAGTLSIVGVGVWPVVCEIG